MEAASGWDGVASLVLLLMVVLADALVGALPGLRVVLDAPLNAMRWVAGWFDGKLNRVRRGGETRRLRGLIVVVVVLALAWLIGTGLSGAARSLPEGWIIEAAALFTLLRYRACLSWMLSGRRLLDAGNVDDAREAVNALVRYDVRALDSFGIARAAIEGGAARFADRFLATIFWYLLLGLPGAFVCRSLNAAADIIGRYSPRHESFGFVAARLDYVLNLGPSLIAGPVIGLAAIFVPRASAFAAFGGWFDDLKERGARPDYRGEGAVAGALGVALGGPRSFGDKTVAGAWVGDGRARATSPDIQRAVFLISVACLLVAIVLALAIGH
jgi:adenosylcobinamide-phosphate synthase